MIQTCVLEEKIVIEFEQNLDTARCDEIEGEVCGFSTDTSQAVEFDLAKVEFVSSAFLRLCIRASQRAGVGRFQIINANPSIKRVFKIAGLDAMFQEN